jgi:hypothetical protein
MMKSLTTELSGPVFLVDGGETLVQDTRGRRAPNGRDRAKAALIAQENVAMGLAAAAIGPSEWATLGREGVKVLADDGYPVTAANLVCEDGARPFPAVRILEDRGRSVGVIGVTAGEVPGCTVTDPAIALADAVALLEGRGVDLTLALWPDRAEAAHHAALKGLPVDVVLDASGRMTQPDRPLRAGSSWLLGALGQTKELGVLTVTPGSGAGLFPPDHDGALHARQVDITRRHEKMVEAHEAAPTPLTARQLAAVEERLAAVERDVAAYADGSAGRFTFTRHLLDDEVAADPAVEARVATVKAGFGMLADAAPSAILARTLVGPEGSGYAGGAACTSCHADATRQWRTTGHARAYTALLRDDRHLDDACYSCHVTGAGAAFTTPEEVGGLIHVQCEACHGPSAAHVQSPAENKPVRVPEVTVCTGCHDGTKDGGRFDRSTYWPKVVHGKRSEGTE